MRDYRPYKKIFDRDGFVVVHDFLTEKELGELQSQLGRYIRDHSPTLPGTHAFYQDKARPGQTEQIGGTQPLRLCLGIHGPELQGGRSGRGPARAGSRQAA